MAQARTEYEGEFEEEYEDELEGEEFLSGLAKMAGSLLGEGEAEYEDELESEYEYEAEEELEGEYEAEFESRLQSEFEGEEEYESEDELAGEYESEALLGGLAKFAAPRLAEGEEEYEGEEELESEYEAEAEYFFKGVARFIRRNKGLLKKIAKTAAPLIATAVGGPAAGMVARAVTSQLEGEVEAELEEMATAPVSPQAALGEYLAARAATAKTDAESEAFIGSAVTVALSHRNRRELEELLPHLLRGATLLTRILRRSPNSRQAVRLVPGIVDTSSGTLARYRVGGRVISPADVGAVLGRSARRVLADPRWQSAVIRRHARGLAHMRRRRQAYISRRRGPVLISPRRRLVRDLTTSGGTIRRRPLHTHALRTRARVTRPRPGFVRIVTPVRVPPRGGMPARTVRVVSDVKVPRGAMPAGRPTSVGGRSR
jgi:hypothetical protein